MISTVLRVVQGWVKIRGADGTVIGNEGDRLKTTTDLSIDEALEVRNDDLLCELKTITKELKKMNVYLSLASFETVTSDDRDDTESDEE